MRKNLGAVLNWSTTKIQKYEFLSAYILISKKRKSIKIPPLKFGGNGGNNIYDFRYVIRIRQYSTANSIETNKNSQLLKSL